MYDKNPLLNSLLQSLDDIQAIDVKVLEVSELTTVTDFMVVCSGRSSRHIKAIAQHVMEEMKAKGSPALSDNGLDSGDWVLIDFGDIVLHVMQPESRAFYNLEGLWQNQP